MEALKKDIIIQKVSDIVEKVINPENTVRVAHDLIGSLTIFTFSELVYRLQKKAIEDALKDKFRITNPFGPGGE